MPAEGGQNIKTEQPKEKLD